MSSKLILALPAFAALAVPASLRGDVIPVLPAASDFQYGKIQTQADVTAYPAATYTATFGSGSLGANMANAPLSAAAGPVRVTSSALGGNDPSVSASAQIPGNFAQYAGGELTGSSELMYSFEATGPAGGFTPIDIAASGAASVQSPGAPAGRAPVTSAVALLQIEAELPLGGVQPVNYLSSLVAQASAGASLTSNPLVPSFAVNQTYLLSNGTQYDVLLEAIADSAPVDASFLATAYVDPTIQLDSLASAADHLYFSPGLGATDMTGTAPTPVPEPTGLTLLGTGVLGLAGVARRWVLGRR